MQTFLPEPSFYTSAQVLDNKRLGKQRVEGYQILRTLTGKSTGWANHPAVKMWRGYELSVYGYVKEVCLAWRSRGFKDTILDKLHNEFPEFSWTRFEVDYEARPPRWCTNEFIESHRSNLIRKDPVYYRRYWPDTPDNLPYIWPVS